MAPRRPLPKVGRRIFSRPKRSNREKSLRKKHNDLLMEVQGLLSAGRDLILLLIRTGILSWQAVAEIVPQVLMEELLKFSDLSDQPESRISTTRGNIGCVICRKKDNSIIRCDRLLCRRTFHAKCHIPAVANPKNNKPWFCNYCTSKEDIEEEIQGCVKEKIPEIPLLPVNKKEFLLACKFLTECYKIPEMFTMRWVFPGDYKDEYGNPIPIHLTLIRERLCFKKPINFFGVVDMLGTFNHMFCQTFSHYNNKYQPIAMKCFKKFWTLLEDYYPEHKFIFHNITPHLLHRNSRGQQ